MTGPVLFLDSGAGGLPYCHDFQLRRPGLPLVYVADRANFPYGPRGREELAGLLTALTGRLIVGFKPRLIVLACNTASVSALDALRRAFPALPFVGTVPAVKPAAEGSLSRRIGVLGTERTVEDPCIAGLAARYGGDCSLIALAAPELVDFVERRLEEAGGEERLAAVRPYVSRFREAGADALVLGCTHFLLLREEFRQAAGPGIRIYDSVEGVSRRVESLLGTGPAAVKDAAESLLVLSGGAPPEPAWGKRAERFGLRLGLLDDVV
jgi:glutamate racemase